MSIKVFRWLLFSVLFSLVPLLLDWLIMFKTFEHSPSLSQIVGRGELCLIATTLSGVAVGEMLASKGKSEYAQSALVFGSIASLVINCAIYVLMKSANEGNPDPFFVKMSFVALIVTCPSSNDLRLFVFLKIGVSGSVWGLI